MGSEKLFLGERRADLLGFEFWVLGFWILGLGFWVLDLGLPGALWWGMRPTRANCIPRAPPSQQPVHVVVLLYLMEVPRKSQTDPHSSPPEPVHFVVLLYEGPTRPPRRAKRTPITAPPPEPVDVIDAVLPGAKAASFGLWALGVDDQLFESMLRPRTWLI